MALTDRKYDLILTTLERVPPSQIARVFNTAFADYFIPMNFSMEAFTRKMIAENIVPELSAGVVIENNITGFILTGINADKKHAYNAGTGVFKAIRGNGLTEKMYEYLLPQLALHGIHQHQLEVLVQNKTAISAYEKTGFAATRSLLCFRGRVTAYDACSGIQIRSSTLPGPSVISSWWNFEPAWQNSTAAIHNSLCRMRILGAYHQEKMVGYLIYEQVSGRVKQFAVAPQFRKRGIGKALFVAVQDKVRGDISILNIDRSDSITVSFLQHMGFRVTAEQLEMRLNYF